MGGFEGMVSAVLDPSVKYHSVLFVRSNPDGKNGREQYLAGSLFGANPS